MLATAMEKANSELGLTAFKTPEEYLELDDYTVWSALKKCKESRGIIANLESRLMLKCAYERTFYEKDTMISNIFGRESYRRQMQIEIAKEACVEIESVIIDVPTVRALPSRSAYGIYGNSSFRKKPSRRKNTTTAKRDFKDF